MLPWQPEQGTWVPCDKGQLSLAPSSSITFIPGGITLKLPFCCWSFGINTSWVTLVMSRGEGHPLYYEAVLDPALWKVLGKKNTSCLDSAGKILLQTSVHEEHLVRRPKCSVHGDACLPLVQNHIDAPSQSHRGPGTVASHLDMSRIPRPTSKVSCKCETLDTCCRDPCKASPVSRVPPTLSITENFFN